VFIRSFELESIDVRQNRREQAEQAEDVRHPIRVQARPRRDLRLASDFTPVDLRLPLPRERMQMDDPRQLWQRPLLRRVGSATLRPRDHLGWRDVWNAPLEPAPEPRRGTAR
jgi:hypothetical protein